MQTSCIYCGNRMATEKDHVPPKSFFPKPRPTNLITVPSCSACNRILGKDDEQVRNILTSLHTTERHPAISNYLSHKRNRSITRKEGANQFHHLIESLKSVDLKSSQGAYLGSALAFDLDQEPMNRFLDRMTRALLYHENSVGHANCTIQWRMPPPLEKWAQLCDKYKQLLSPQALCSIGEDLFNYVGYFRSRRAASLWFMSFYEGLNL